MIPILGSSLLWAEETPAAAGDALPARTPEALEGGNAESSSSGEKQKRNEEKREKDSKDGQPGGEHHGRRGLFWKDMNDSQRERLLYYHHLIIRKYDLNRSGVLEPEEMEALKKDSRRFREERRQLILKKFDKNGDGKLDEEERKAMREELRIHIEKRLKARKEGKSADDDDMPPPPPPMRRGREARPDIPGSGKMDMERKDDPPRAGEGKEKGKDYGREGRGQGRQKGTHGPDKGRGWGPEGMIMSLGYHLMMDQFDKDKDGKLSPEERKAYDEDRAKFNRWLNAMRKKLKEKGCLEEIEKNPPPISMVSPKCSDEKVASPKGKDGAEGTVAGQG